MVIRALCLGLFAALAAAQQQQPQQQPQPQQPSVAELVELGRAQAQQRDFARAIETLTRALAAHADDLDALRWRGHAYTGAQRYDEAFQDLDRALELGADDAWTHYAHAMALHHRGQLEQALQGYTRALAIDPEFVKAWEWRGFTRSRLGDHIGAVADLDVAVARDPNNSWLYFIRAKACAALLDLARAEPDLWKVVDADSHNADAQAQLGYLKACRGEPAAAKSFLERAVALDANGQVEARLWLYELLADEGDAAAARAQLDAVRAAAAAASGADATALQWPLQLAALLRGEAKLEALLAAADAGPADERSSRRCAALLHAGLLAARGHDRDAALLLLARALGTDATEQWEWSLARLRLRQLCGDAAAK